MTLECDLNLSPRSWIMGFAQSQPVKNIWVRFNENISKGSGDMERTRSVTLRLRSRVMDSAHRLTGGTFGSSLVKIVRGIQEICSGHEIPWPWSVTLTLNLDSWERNNWVKMNENRSKGWVDIERAWNSRVHKSHDLEVWSRPWVSVAESRVLHTVSVIETFGRSLIKIVRREQTWSGHEI